MVVGPFGDGIARLRRERLDTTRRRNARREPLAELGVSANSRVRGDDQRVRVRLAHRRRDCGARLEALVTDSGRHRREYPQRRDAHVRERPLRARQHRGHPLRGVAGRSEHRSAGPQLGEFIDVRVAPEGALDQGHRRVGIAEQVERRGGERDGDSRPVGPLEMPDDGVGGASDAHLEDLPLLGDEPQQLARRVPQQRDSGHRRGADGRAEENVDLASGGLLARAEDARGPQEPRRSSLGPPGELRHLLDGTSRKRPVAGALGRAR